MFFQNYKNILKTIKIHFLGLNRIIENKLFLNTFYLIIIIIIFTITIFLYMYKEKKYFLFLIDSKIIENIIWLFPTLIIIFISIYTIKSSYYLNPFKIIYKNINPLIIEVISLNWKWMFIFPKQKILTINEICIPILKPIKIYLISNSIMNSLCFPKIGYQLYSMTNCLKFFFIFIIKHGIAHASSSNYSGNGFSYMRINIFCVIKKTFYYWINKIKNSIFFNIYNYNYFIKNGVLINSKFFNIRNNKIFISLINKK